MKKTKLFLSITLCAALFLCISSNASAVLVNQTYSGDRVVYDTLNDLYWYMPDRATGRLPRGAKPLP